MAATRVFALHVGKGRSASTAIGDIIDYVENPEKTDKGRLITSYECDSRVADKEFLLAKREYHYITGRDQGGKDVFAYHIRQSFKPGEVSPEEANEIGRQLALSYTKGNHAFIVCTHIDRRHVHNHIIFNSTALNNERKFDDPKRSAKIIRRISDLLCAQHGLSVIEHPKPSRGSYGTWLGDKKEPSFKENLCAAIDMVLAKNPVNFEAFINLMVASGYKIKRGKHIKLTGPGEKRGWRLDTLDGDYTERAIHERIAGTRIVVPSGGKTPEPEQEPEQEEEVRPTTGTHSAGGVTPAFIPMPMPDTRFKLLIDIEENLRQGKGAGYANWARSFNLKEAAKTLIFLQESGVESYDDLVKKTAAASAGFRTRVEKIKAAETRMGEIRELQIQTANYSKTREVYKQYKASGCSAKFRAAHEKEIILHQTAKRHFDSLNLKKLPSIAALKQEYATLLAERKRQYVGYSEAKKNMKQLVLAKGNVARILGLNDNTSKVKTQKAKVNGDASVIRPTREAKPERRSR